MSEIDTLDKLRTIAIDEEYTSVDTQAPTPARSNDIVASTGEELDTEEAKSKFSGISQAAFAEVFSRGQLYNKTADQLLQEASDLTIKQREFNENPEFVTEQALTQGNVEWDDLQTRLATNYQIADEVASKVRSKAESDATWFNYGADFIDRYIFRQFPIGMVEDFSARTESTGREILTKAATLPPKEFRKWIENYAVQVGEEGFFGSNNIFAAMEFQDRVTNKGFDPMKETTQALALLDLPGFVTAAKALKAANKLGSSIRSTTAVGRVTAVAGDGAGKAAAEAVLRKSADPETLGIMGNPAQDLNVAGTPVRPSNSGFLAKFQENRIIQEVARLWRSGSFGRVVTEARLKEVAQKIAKDYAEKTTNVLRDGIDLLDEGLGVYVAKFRFGKVTDGSPFLPIQTRAVREAGRVVTVLEDGTQVRASQRLSEFGETTGTGTGVPPVDVEYKPTPSVKKLAEKIGPNAEVVPFDPSDLSKGFVVEVTERIDTLGLPEAVGIELNVAGGVVRNTIGRLFNNSLMGSAALRDNQRLSVLAQMGQAGRGAIKDIVRPYENAIKALDSKADFTIRAVYSKLRDGPDSHLRVRYTDEEFKQEYKELHPNKADATDKELKAYQALATVEEADYILKATREIQRYVAKGYDRAVEVAPDIFVPAKQIKRSELGPDDIVNTIKGKIYGTIDEIADYLPDDLPIWKLDKPLDTGEKFVIEPLSARLIDPTDVMGYNPGGTRINPFAKYFIVLGGASKRLKSLMSTFSEVDAGTALNQIKRIRDAIKAGDGNIDNVIKNNNDWNPAIDSKAKFDEFIYTEGWVKNPGDRLEGDIAIKGRNDEIISGEIDNPDIWSGVKASDYVENDMRRQDRVLMDFGGGRAYNEDPVSSVFAQLGNSVYTYTNRAYTQNAMVGWVKAVQDAGRTWFQPGISKTDYETLFRTAEIRGNDAFARRMREMRNITLRRLDMQDEASEYMNRLGGQVAEYVFQKTGWKLNLGDPTNLLQKVGFQSAFGFMQLSQFVMQGFHATTIMAISPKHGLKAAGMVFSQRGLLGAVKDPIAYKEGVARLAKVHGLTEETAEELLEYVRTSGRAIVDGDAIEAGTGVGWGLSRWRGDNLEYSRLKGLAGQLTDAAGRGLSIGLYPFKAGERLSRLTAINTAFLEFKEQFPRISALSDTGREWITRREQALTFNMSVVDKAKVQSSLMKAPTQWLSYSFRSMEAVFVGREFTALERARLFAVLGPMYGLSGFTTAEFGLNTAADYIAEKLDIEPGGSWYVGLKNGFLDGLSVALAGPKYAVSVGPRLAPIGALFDTYKKIFEEETYTAIAGPSGEITGGIIRSFVNAADNLINGHTVALTEDILTILRQPSALNNYAKAIGIFNNGQYRSKNGLAVGPELNTTEGLISGFGFTPARIQEFYARRTGEVFNKKELSAFRKEINTDAENAFRLIEAGDQRGYELLNEIHAKIATSGFSFRDQVSLRKSASNRLEREWPRIAERLLQQDRLYSLRATENILYPERKE